MRTFNVGVTAENQFLKVLMTIVAVKLENRHGV